MSESIERHLYKQIQEETGHYIVDIKHVIQFMFGEVRRTIEEGDLQQIDLQYLGSFGVKPGRTYKLEERNIKPKKKQ